MKPLLWITIFFAAATVLGENNATITHVADGWVPSTPGRLAEYASDVENNPHAVAPTIVRELSGALLTPTAVLDFQTNYYSVVFAAKAKQVKDRQIYRLLIHGPQGHESVVDHLIGTKTFYEIFLAEDDDGAIQTVVSTKPIENPLQANIVKAAKAIVEPAVALGGSVAKIQGRAIGPTAKLNTRLPSAFGLKILLRRIDVDDERADVNIATTILDRAAITGTALAGKLS